MEEPTKVWIESLRGRLNSVTKAEDGCAISIKLRNPGCFCRSCCPHAWRQIDEVLPRQRYQNDEFHFEEHETGPEIIVYLAVAAGGIGLAKSIVELITAIIKARSDGTSKGDKAYAPVRIEIRGLTVNNNYVQKEVLTVSDHSAFDGEKFKGAIDAAITELFIDEP